MSTVVVTCSLSDRVVGIKGVLTAELGHLVAEAFTPERSAQLPLHQVLRQVFGNAVFAKYTADLSAAVYRITYSSVEKPKVLTFQGNVAQIAPPDADPFLLCLEQIDVIAPGRSTRTRAHPNWIH